MGVLLDASVLIRLDKCSALERLQGFSALHASGHVYKEFSAGGPSQRALLKRLKITRHAVLPGTLEWEAYCEVRGGRFGTRDLGEDESIGICLAEARRRRFLPFVTFDRHAGTRAEELGIVTIDFLALLSWMVARGNLSHGEADQIEQTAGKRNGWARPPTFGGGIQTVAKKLIQNTAAALDEWRRRRR